MTDTDDAPEWPDPADYPRPGISGEEMLERLREASKKTPAPTRHMGKTPPL